MEKLLKIFVELEKQECKEINKPIFDKVANKIYGFCSKTRREYFDTAILSGFLEPIGSGIYEINYAEVQETIENFKNNRS